MVLRICKSFAIILSHLSLLCLCGKWNLMYCNRLPLAANHVPLVAHVILLECVICFPCLSEYRHQPIPALHIPCTAWNITFISMICHFRCCPRLFLHNTCRTSDGSAGVWYRTWAGICVTVGVMFWFAYFSVVFFIHKIYIRRRKQWCLRLTVCHFHVQNSYSTMPR